MKTTSKKLLAVLLSLVMLFSVTSVAVFAETETNTDCYYEQGEYSIHYTVVPAEGEYKGRILFIHGFLYSGTTWNGVADIMSAEGYDCYLVDLPNFGYSTRENKNTTLIAREDLMVGLMESVAPLNEWIVAGHSMGGGVSLNIACDHPELAGLMLYCPSETYMNGNSIMTSLATSDFMGKMMDSIFKAVLSSDLIVKMAVYMTTGDWDYAKNYNARLLADPLMIEGTGTGMLYSSVNARNTDLDAISQIEIPTLLVWADGDSVISDAIKSNLNSALVNAETVTVEGSHIVIETNPEEISAVTLAFLQK